jgi:hypothetical protein
MQQSTSLWNSQACALSTFWEVQPPSEMILDLDTTDDEEVAATRVAHTAQTSWTTKIGMLPWNCVIAPR